ncbi:response regulator transcription factor [Thiospirochaeta perfilievii]|uniref:Response regulator transcription factor n=1 Tax=Thiospirochaeta perfilievii TaxID=252967 RepID=A0A5C1QE92_9SPIO|nr:response regulator transcription factor [Thiospirochaeta perfilievii]QEN04532.1 response regulator transcription factor [Thiospirochaeta perfilievii]
MKKILIIEDEVGVQITLEDRLVAEGYNVTIKGDGIEGENEAKTGKYDIILLDIMLPNRDGFAICENIRKAKIQVPILMLTARNTDLDTVLGLRQGADDYLAKPFVMSILIARIEALLRRSTINKGAKNVESKIFFGDFVLDQELGELFCSNELIPLNTLEYRLLLYLTKNCNAIISRDQLLDDVWGYETETNSRTVDVHIAKLRAKLGESELPKHIQTVRGRGYKFKI